MIMRSDGATTSPTLLRRAADWADLPAWREFFARYDPLLRQWCRRFLADESEVCEVTQRIWLELTDRMVGFRYDPRKTFRGWLRDLCRCRSIDYLRARERERRHRVDLSEAMMDQWTSNAKVWACEANDDEVDESDGPLLFLQEADIAQALVRSRVSGRTWQVFWRIAIDGESIRDVADDQKMSYAGAFAAYSRVERMLREEGSQRLMALACSR